MADSVLLGDIGGTHSRFAFLGSDGRPAQAQAFDDDAVGGVAEAIAKYLKAVGGKPTEAVLAVAAAVTKAEVTLTNRDWRFRPDDLKAQFGLKRLRIVNDFEAQAWALPLLGASDVQPIGASAETAHGPKVVLGPGTGLGVAALVTTGQGWFAVASEAGHISFGPAAADEAQVFARLRDSTHVSAEWLLSGPGLERLHTALNPGAPALDAAAIAAGAKRGDAAAQTTKRLFVRLLGRFAGDMALVFKATGGVYVSGGVAQGFGQDFDNGIFRQAFEAHPPYDALLAQIPTCLVIRRQSGLLGCAALALTE